MHAIKQNFNKIYFNKNISLVVWNFWALEFLGPSEVVNSPSIAVKVEDTYMYKHIRIGFLYIHVHTTVYKNCHAVQHIWKLCRYKYMKYAEHDNSILWC